MWGRKMYQPLQTMLTEEEGPYDEDDKTNFSPRGKNER
jgi:hypothetical protein